MENSKSTFKAFDIDSMLDSLEDQLEEESSSEKRAKEAITNIPSNSSSLKAESHNNKEETPIPVPSPNNNRSIAVNNVISSLNDYINSSLSFTETNNSNTIQDVDSLNNKDEYTSNYSYQEQVNENVDATISNSSTPTESSSSITSTADNVESNSSTTTSSSPDFHDSNATSHLITNDSENDDDDGENDDKETSKIDTLNKRTETDVEEEQIVMETSATVTGSLSYACLENNETHTIENDEEMTSSIAEFSKTYTATENELTPRVEGDETFNIDINEQKDFIEPRPNLPEIDNETKEDENIDKIGKTDNEASERKSTAFGFESTMDDISDNELESFLQELEELKECEDVPLDSEDALQKLTEIAEVAEVAEILIEPEILVSRKVKGKETDVEEDRISQASTIDCSESHISVDKAVEKLEEAVMEKKKPKKQPKEEILEEPVLDEVHEAKEISNESDEVKEAVEEPQKMEVESMSEQPIIMKKPEQLERPTTLDIPSAEDALNTIEPVVINEAIATSIEINPIDSDHGLSSSSEEYSVNSLPHPQNLDEDDTNESNSITSSNYSGISNQQLGKQPPFWIPDSVSQNCMQCNLRFSIIKRRHHCRCCGLLLCSQCCSAKAKLEWMGDVEARICGQCEMILSRMNESAPSTPLNADGSIVRQPNPNNPLEYCSIIPPHQQVNNEQPTPSVMVPVSVLKRVNAPKTERKNVIFSDGIRPGCDLTELDENWNNASSSSRATTSRSSSRKPTIQTPPGTIDKKFKFNTNMPPTNEQNNSFIPAGPEGLPPIFSQEKSDFKFLDVVNDKTLIERLQQEQLKFVISKNFYVICKIIKLTCCTNKTVINYTTEGLSHRGQDEIIILLEQDEMNQLPKDIFLHLNDIYNDADKGNTITEFGYSLSKSGSLLGSKENGGFLFIKPTFQCLQSVILPDAPYLVGLLIHRWEIPWAKIFPLRLMLRLGALYRYYPSPLVSCAGREPVFAEIGQTIMNFLADFRAYTFSIESIRGMFIHMEERKTTVLIPRNRYDQVMKVINNSSDHLLAFGADFSKQADGHLVCIQNIDSGSSESFSYSTQAINIQGQPRLVTGASFFVLNGALKSNSGLSGKCSIVEDGMMIQILPTKMQSVRESLKSMKNIEIICGPVECENEKLTEIVNIEWTENDLNFNVGVISPIDRRSMSGKPSIRVHRGFDHSNQNHMIRWTEVFILESDDELSASRLRSINDDQIDFSKVSEHIAKSSCTAMIPFLDLLAVNNLKKIAIRVTLGENVCYEAGSCYQKLAPLYMNALDNELIGVLHNQATNLNIDTSIVLELVFHILKK